MLLTISNTQPPATDLGYLLHKNPARLQSFDLSFGRAHVFYPEATDEICTAALLLDVDPVGLVRNRRGPGGEGHALEQYVNDRPYVASSFLSVAIARVFGSALQGRSKERESLAEAQLPLKAAISVLPCRGGEESGPPTTSGSPRSEVVGCRSPCFGGLPISPETCRRRCRPWRHPAACRSERRPERPV